MGLKGHLTVCLYYPFQDKVIRVALKRADFLLRSFLRLLLAEFANSTTGTHQEKLDFALFTHNAMFHLVHLVFVDYAFFADIFSG